MAIPRGVLTNAETRLSSYCEKKIPKTIRDKLVLGFVVKGNSIVLYERRPHYRDKEKKVDCSIAKIKYLTKTHEWELFYQDRNLLWHKYWDYGPKKRISTIINEIDKDPTGIFWG